MIHLLLSVEMSRIVSPDNLDIQTIILVSQPHGPSDLDAYTLLTILLLSMAA